MTDKPTDLTTPLGRALWILSTDERGTRRELDAFDALVVGAVEAPVCRVYWGSHGCQYERGHDGPHECNCCDCDQQPCHDYCVAKPPYYGPNTNFYGEDA